MLEKIIILDFGSQDTQMICRKVRELKVYCEIIPHNKFPENTDGIKAVILSDSPLSLGDPKALQMDLSVIPENIPVLAIGYGADLVVLQKGKKNLDKKWNLQFDANVFLKDDGVVILDEFVKSSECQRSWSPANFIEFTIRELRDQLQDDKVVLGLSGGVDSSVAAVLLHKAIGKNLTCVFVDNGLLRKNEFESVLVDYKHLGLNVRGVNAQDYFYKLLKGVSDPEEKRKIIGAAFIDIFDKEAHKIKDVKWLVQGTIYPDIVESINVLGGIIKSHHNVGGLPEKMNLKLCEPLRLLFKDEVRKVGVELGMMRHLVNRHPFPGPGLGIRIIGDITKEKIHILQEADAIFIDELHKWNLYNKVWQAGVILLPIQSVGVSDNKRTYENTAALRAVTSIDATVAEWAHLPHEFLDTVAQKIMKQVKGINRVVYDISSKPPATIEWE